MPFGDRSAWKKKALIDKSNASELFFELKI